MLASEEIISLIQSGEGFNLEFKRKVQPDLGREICAFANAKGGRILIGVEDNGKICGYNDANRERSNIQLIARNCDPPIEINLESAAQVMIVDVPEGNNKPYRCSDGFLFEKGQVQLNSALGK